jgi:hypothetical protein
MALESEINNKIALANDSLRFWNSKAASALNSLDEARDSYNYYNKVANSGVSGTVSQDDIAQAKTAADTALSNMNFFKQQYNDASNKVSEVTTEIEGLTVELNNAQNPSNPVPPPSVVNPSSSDDETLQKYQDAEIVGDTDTTNYSNEGRAYSKGIAETNPGALQTTPGDVSVVFKSIAGDQINSDMRVKIQVPTDYLTTLTSGSKLALKNLQGIIFPYTPNISVKHSAEYSDQQPLHSNFSVYFYKRSKVDPITISGKFTVQNDSDAENFIATVHLLRALTKMRSGGSSGDADSGAPPPVCRLHAYGTFMLQNVPVVISSFSLTLPDNVDYFTYGKTISGKYEKTAVPVLSTIEVVCNPIYSRDEMRKFNVTGWLNQKYIRKAGYL